MKECHFGFPRNGEWSLALLLYILGMLILPNGSPIAIDLVLDLGLVLGCPLPCFAFSLKVFDSEPPRPDHQQNSPPLVLHFVYL